ncbi:E3 ubiquitin protein ligase UPL5-like protein, partial [Tanacetum coccineum]
VDSSVQSLDRHHGCSFLMPVISFHYLSFSSILIRSLSEELGKASHRADTCILKTKELCDGTNGLDLGPICGRPLALSFDYITSDSRIQGSPGVGGPTANIHRDCVLVPESVNKTIIRYWLEGPKVGTTVVFLTDCGDELEMLVYHEMFGPILLHFCKLLCQVVKYLDDDFVNFLFGLSETVVHDFKTFVLFSMDVIANPMAFEMRIPVCYHHKHPCLIRNLRDGGWDQYFSILNLLHYIAQKYEGVEEIYYTSLKPCKTFKLRRNLVMMLLPEVTNDYDNLHEMLINRSNLLAESFESITGAEIAALHGPMHIGFINEEDTGPGVLREWFLLGDGKNVGNNT